MLHKYYYRSTYSSYGMFAFKQASGYQILACSEASEILEL